MNNKLLQEQMQQDILNVLVNFGVEGALSPIEWHALQNTLCDLVIVNIKKD